jgi:hypothetical protein
MDRDPSRIDLLELDIDLRLADLWREAAGISEGYCDALTEDLPGTLCAEHGYRVPDRKRQPA